MRRGALETVSASDHTELLANTVSRALRLLPGASEIGVAEINPVLSDTAAFCEHYKIRPDQAANCVVLRASKGDKTWFAACVVLASTRADINGLARKTLDARRISFAPMESAVEATGMEYGAITPIGLPADWPVLIDKAVVDADSVIMGSGIRNSKLVLAGRLLSWLPNAQVLEGLGRASN
jgi:prolyl-tRNA editing enzyme YbaK/EbsC (Cys-tRNA(Pro) deacylase)